MLAIVLALAAGASWGGGCFLSGSQTRRTSLWTVIVFSQLAGLCLMAVIVLARGQALPGEVVLPALAAGVLSVVSVAASYQALAIGVMCIIGPIISLSVAVPVVVGLAAGERPFVVQLAGIAVALCGVILASRQRSAGKCHQATSRASVGLAVLTAVVWGFVMVLYAKGGESDPSWTVFLARSTSAAILAVAFVVVRPRLKLTRAAAVPIMAIGAFEVAGNQLFAVAATLGYLSIASVLSSVYPVFVIGLAYLLLHERLSRTQQLGIAAALTGVALIAAG
jgi:drug/metabolite transporter (DMT)-like permease